MTKRKAVVVATVLATMLCVAGIAAAQECDDEEWSVTLEEPDTELFGTNEGNVGKGGEASICSSGVHVSVQSDVPVPYRLFVELAISVPGSWESLSASVDGREVLMTRGHNGHVSLPVVASGAPLELLDTASLVVSALMDGYRLDITTHPSGKQYTISLRGSHRTITALWNHHR